MTKEEAEKTRQLLPDSLTGEAALQSSIVDPLLAPLGDTSGSGGYISSRRRATRQSTLEQLLSFNNLNSNDTGDDLPDLVVQNASLLTEAGPGSDITVDYEVTNQGSGAAGSSWTYFYLSQDPNFSEDDIELGYQYLNSLNAGETSPKSKSLPLPSSLTPGDYYLLFHADGYDDEIPESNETNNVFAQAIEINLPDLLVQNLSLPPEASPGSSITVNYEVINQGSGAAGSSWTYFHLSSDSTLSDDDIELGYQSLNSLNVGETSPQSKSLSLPTSLTPGNYYLLFQADGYDDEIPESNETNNVLAQAIEITLPDPPDLPDLPDQAGNSLNDALDITVGDEPSIFSDWVGATDTDDYYRFTVAESSNFSLSLTELVDDAHVKLLDSSGTKLVQSFNYGTNDENINVQLLAGTYYIHVYPRYSFDNTNYNLSVAATPVIEAGNSLNDALDITVGDEPSIFSDWVGATDTDDYYRFTVAESSNFSLSLTELVDDAHVKLLDSSGTELVQSFNYGTNDENINVQLLAGTYYIHVYPRYSFDNTNYNLSVEIGDAYEGNDTLAAAYNLNSYERIWLSNIAGEGSQFDEDWYQIDIDSGHEHLLVDMQFTHAEGDINLAVYDASGNIVESSTSVTDNESIDTILPDSGTYYLQVSGDNAGNTYDLRWEDVPMPGEIRGTVWNDLDGDGSEDVGEAGLENWMLYLDQNRNGQFDAGEISTITDANGNYAFAGLEPYNIYHVAQVVQSGWEQTYPGGAEVQGNREQTYSNSSRSAFGQKLDQLRSSITTTGSEARFHTQEMVSASGGIKIAPQSDDSGPLIELDTFRDDPRFPGIDGSGYTIAILDSGITHTGHQERFFGPDSDGDGVADRIVYQYDFAEKDSDARDFSHHGSHVAGIAASSDPHLTGVAPGANLWIGKVLPDSLHKDGTFADLEVALQKVIETADEYNIVAVNMSLGDGKNYNTAQSPEEYLIGDELATLAEMGIIVVSAAGNYYDDYDDEPGVAYPAADPNSLAIGATWVESSGEEWHWLSGAVDYTTGADRIVSFSQRHATLIDAFAPGAELLNANATGGSIPMSGTSQAAPHVTGMAVLAQQLAEQELGRRLTVSEFRDLLRSTGVTIHDGDDEDDNVNNTGLDFKRVDMLALGEAILEMDGGVYVGAGQIAEDIDFGNIALASTGLAPTGGDDVII